jgi:hypothetical protein
MRCCSSNTALVEARLPVLAAPLGVAGALATGAAAAGWPTVAVNAGTGAAAIGAMAVGGAAGLCATADVQAAVPAKTATAAAMANPL